MKGHENVYRGHVATFAVFVALAAGFLLWYIGIGGGLPSMGDDYRVKALLPSAGSLTPGARVTMAGAKVGRVIEVRRRGRRRRGLDADRRRARQPDPGRHADPRCATARRWARTT